MEAYAAQDRSQPEEALPLAERAVELYAELAPRSVEMARALTRVGRTHASNGAIELALGYYEAALDIMREVGEPTGLVIALLAIGTLEYRRGGLDRALRCLKEALAVTQSTRWGAIDKERVQNQATALGGIGMVHLARTDLAPALSYFLRALELYDEVGPTPAGPGGTLNHIGQVYLAKEDLDQALEYFERSLEVHQAGATTPATAAALTNIGAVHLRRGELDTAMSYLGQARAILSDMAPRSEGAARVASRTGEVWLERGEVERARLACQEGLEIAEALSPRSLDTARALIALGLAARASGDLKGALLLFERALEIAEAAAPTCAETEKALKNIAATHEFQGDLGLAEGFSNRAAELKDRRKPGGCSSHGDPA